MVGSTPAWAHRPFISRQICFLDRLPPPLVRKTSPEAILCFWAYFSSFRQSLPGSRTAPSGRLHGDIPKLGHPYAGGADGLQQQLQPGLPAASGGVHQALVLPPGQLPGTLPEGPALELQIPRLAPFRPQKHQQAVDCGQLGVHRGRGPALGDQRLFPGVDQLFAHRPPLQPRGEGPRVPQVLFHRGGGPLLLEQMVPITVQTVDI